MPTTITTGSGEPKNGRHIASTGEEIQVQNHRAATASPSVTTANAASIQVRAPRAGRGATEGATSAASAWMVPLAVSNWLTAAIGTIAVSGVTIPTPGAKNTGTYE